MKSSYSAMLYVFGVTCDGNDLQQLMLCGGSCRLVACEICVKMALILSFNICW